MLRLLLALGIGLPLFGSIFVWRGLEQREVARASFQIPETISLSKLVARGPEGNANIILTDFVAIKPHVVQRGKRGVYSGTWIPIVPKDAAPPDGGPPAGGVKAFVYSDKVRNPEGAYQRLANPQLPGMVSNKIMTPNGNAMDELKEKYPQTDFSSCIFIYEGHEPITEETAALVIYGGVAAVVVGIGALGLCLLLWRKSAAEDARRKKRRNEDDDEDYRPRKRQKLAHHDDDDRLRQNRRPADDEDDEPRRKRPSVSRDDDDDDRPRRRSRRDDD
jgi:hypothetical protein